MRLNGLSPLLKNKLGKTFSNTNWAIDFPTETTLVGGSKKKTKSKSQKKNKYYCPKGFRLMTSPHVLKHMWPVHNC